MKRKIINMFVILLMAFALVSCGQTQETPDNPDINLDDPDNNGKNPGGEDNPNDEPKEIEFIVSLVFDGEFVIHDIKIINSEKGLFVAMPSKRDGNGDFKDIAHPIKTSVRQYLQDAVIAKYNEVIGDTN